MKRVIWEDEKNPGTLHASYLRDDDSDHLAPSGIPDDPPDLTALDWDGLIVNLHNALIKRGLSTMQDVNEQQNGVSSSIVSVLKGPIVRLYKQKAMEAKSAHGGF